MSPGPGSRAIPKPDRLREKTDYRRGAKRLDLAWRMAVKNRDRWRCQLCGCVVRNTIEFIPQRAEADHVYCKSTYPELRHEIDNGCTECLECHRRAQKDRSLIPAAIRARARACWERVQAERAR